MKKTLLCLALASLSAAAFAQDDDALYKEFFKVSYEGQEVNEGDEIVCSKWDDWSFMGAGNGQFIGEVTVTNVGFMPVTLRYKEAPTGLPSWEEYISGDSPYGDIRTCFSGGNCYPNDFNAELFLNVKVDLKTSETLDCEDVFMGTGVADNYMARVQFIIALEEDPDINVSFFMVFTNDPNYTSGINSIATENGAAEYFNLQGQRISNPDKGLYIVRKNGKTFKQILK